MMIVHIKNLITSVIKKRILLLLLLVMSNNVVMSNVVNHHYLQRTADTGWHYKILLLYSSYAALAQYAQYY